MENVYAKSFEKKWYITTPLLALITTQGRCSKPTYAKSRPHEKPMVCILRRVLWGMTPHFSQSA